MANEGLRPYWYDSSVIPPGQYRVRFYYPADIDSITVLDKTTGTSAVLHVKQEGKYLYIRSEFNGGISTSGVYNNGNTVLYDHRQENPIYSNRISKRK